MRVTFANERGSFSITGWQAALWMGAGAAFFFAAPILIALGR